MKPLVFVFLAGLCGSVVSYYSLRVDRIHEGRYLRAVAVHSTDAQLERLNVSDGLLPGRAFSIDDYCGAACRPDSFMWNVCVDACEVR